MHSITMELIFVIRRRTELAVVFNLIPFAVYLKSINHFFVLIAKNY